MLRKKYDRLIALVLALIMAMSLVTGPVFAADGSETPSFKDVPKSEWYYDYVMCLAKKEIVKGYGDTGEFRPMNLVIREHAAKMIALAAGLPYQGKKANFPDVDKEGEMSPYIAALVAKGAVQGFPNGKFKPFDYIERGHAAKMIAIAFDLNDSDLLVELKDLPLHDPVVAEAIETLASNGIVKGYGGTKEFKPAEPINRAELSKMLCIAMAAKAVQKAEELKTPEAIQAAQALVDGLPKEQDTESKDHLQGRLDDMYTFDGSNWNPPAPTPAEGLMAALGPGNATVDGNTVTLIENVTIADALTIPAGVTLNTNGKYVSGTSSSTLEVNGTVYATDFEDVAPFLAQQGTAKFHVGSTLQVFDSEKNRVDTFIGKDGDRETMSVDMGYVTIGIYDYGQTYTSHTQEYGFKLTIPNGSEATIKGYHMSSTSDDYRIAATDQYHVAGKLNINYKTLVTGQIEVAGGGQVHVGEGVHVHLWGGIHEGKLEYVHKRLISDAVLGSEDAVIVAETDGGMHGETLNGVELKETNTLHKWEGGAWEEYDKPGKALAKALGEGNATFTAKDNTVTLKANVTINGTIDITEGVTLKTNGHAISGSGTVNVYGTVEATTFIDVAGIAGGGTVNFHQESTLKVADDTFIGANTMSVDSGYVTIEQYNRNVLPGFKLTITNGATATIQGPHMDGNNDGYRIAVADCYLVQGTLNINYRTEVSGKLEVTSGGKIKVAADKVISLFDVTKEGNPYGGQLVSPANTVTGANGATIIYDSSASNSTLEGKTLVQGNTYTWDDDNKGWDGEYAS